MTLPKLNLQRLLTAAGAVIGGSTAATGAPDGLAAFNGGVALLSGPLLNVHAVTSRPWLRRVLAAAVAGVVAIPTALTVGTSWVTVAQAFAGAFIPALCDPEKVRSGEPTIVVGEQPDDGPVPSAADVAKDKATQQAAGAAAAEAQKHLHPGPQR